MAIINGTAASETLLGSVGNDVITGFGGNDDVRMRAGDDVFVWNAGDGNDRVEGQAGFDSLRFTASAASEFMEISANGTRARVVRSVDSVSMDLNGVERINMRALAGTDTIDILNLAGTGIQQVAIDLAGVVGGLAGDGTTDTVERFGSALSESMNVSLASGKVSITGLSTQVTVSHADSMDHLALYALGGNDVINTSKLTAGIMQLSVDGGTGNDRITGSRGSDVLNGDLGNDIVTGGGGDDLVSLGAGNDVFVWNHGDGSDVVEGDADFDTLRFTGSNAGDKITVSPNGGRAFISSIGIAVLDTNDVELVQVRALEGADSITIGDLSGTEATVGGTLGDTKIDTVAAVGTANDDAIGIASSGGSIVTTGLAAAMSIAHAGATDVLVINGGGGNDVVNAGSLPTGKMALQLLGGAGDDTVTATAGSDAVRGGAGKDVAFLGTGNDVYVWNFGDGSATVEGQGGTDTLQFKGSADDDGITISGVGGHAQVVRGTTNDTIDLDDVERIRIQAGAGADGITIFDLAGTDVKQVAIDLVLAGGVGDGEKDSMLVLGTDGNDTVTVGISGALVSVTGLPAQVTIAHVDGIDQLTIRGEDGNDAISAATIPASKLQFGVFGGDGNDLIIGSAGNNGLQGDLGNDTLRGGAGDDSLGGDYGNDRLEGGVGEDSLNGGVGNDLLLGGADDDFLVGIDGDDTINGGAGDDLVDGDYGNDVLFGGLGDDVLHGGEGNDTITGGAGNDTIVYFSDFHDHDVVLDFDGNPADGQDTVNLDTLFDGWTVATADRAGRVSIVDKGATVEVGVNADGNIGNGFEVTITLHTLDTITVGQDLIVGAL
jgi:Ca2+-binding RTX toxin-like protein